MPVHFTGKGVGQLAMMWLFLYLDPYNGNQMNFFFLPGRRHSLWKGMGAEGPGGVLSALHHSLGRAALLCPGEPRDHFG